MDLADVGINAETEKDHLQKRNDQRKKERSKIAADVQHLFIEDRPEAAKSVKHALPREELAVCRLARRRRLRDWGPAGESRRRQCRSLEAARGDRKDRRGHR